MRRLLLLLAVVLAGVLAVGFTMRRTLAPRLVALLATRPQPRPPPPLDPGVAWRGDWFTIERLDDATIAIGEPRSDGRNVSYLLLGNARAVLFDAGDGVSDLSLVVDDLTDLPVVVIPSHLHFDHLGSIESFATIALPDLPALRAQTKDGVLVPTFDQFLGVVVDRKPPRLHVSEWWKPDEPIDLGGREVVVRHTPGHTPESISLWDPVRRWLFSGDYITPQPLFAFLPGSSIGDYRSTARRLVRTLPEDAVFWGAHDEPTDTLAPQLGITDLRDLARVLEAIGRGEAVASGIFPRVYRGERAAGDLGRHRRQVSLPWFDHEPILARVRAGHLGADGPRPPRQEPAVPSKWRSAASQACAPISAPRTRPPKSSARMWMPPQRRDWPAWSAAS